MRMTKQNNSRETYSPTGRHTKNKKTRALSTIGLLLVSDKMGVFSFLPSSFIVFYPSSDTRRIPRVESARVFRCPCVLSCRSVRFSGAIIIFGFGGWLLFVWGGGGSVGEGGLLLFFLEVSYWLAIIC